MAKKKNNYYVVWNGVRPGIYESWADCQVQIKGYPGAKYMGFKTLRAAEEAYHSSPLEYYKRKDSEDLFTAAGLSSNPISNIIQDSWSVDGACSGNPGKMEYRGVHTHSRDEIFRVGPLPGGTNNIGEILAIVHALALLDKKGDTTTPIYTDSLTAKGWYKKKKINTKLEPTPQNKKVIELVQRAEKWLQTHNPPNQVLKWDTESWGEIPADFGRK